MNIHPTAIIHKGAKVADDVEVGPYTIIEKDAVIRGGTKIGAHCLIGSFTTIGKDNTVFTGAIIGSIPQDLKFKDCRSFVEIGDRNIFREYITVNRATEKDAKTVIGNDNLFMAYSHVAHDCTVGNNVIMANAGTLGGHVTIEDRVIIGGLSGVHQFVRIGKFAILGAISKASQDVPPYCMAEGQRAKVIGLNLVGLKRGGFGPAQIGSIKKAVKILFFSELSITNAIKKIKDELPPSEEIKYLINFVENSARGLAR